MLVWLDSSPEQVLLLSLFVSAACSFLVVNFTTVVLQFLFPCPAESGRLGCFGWAECVILVLVLRGNCVVRLPRRDAIQCPILFSMVSTLRRQRKRLPSLHPSCPMALWCRAWHGIA
ncbi:hypothetical protein B0T17DRAFT_407580 [Bombardia bombarda]|uniref:Uncharacterized protein n=1 Tax=Bombardia bombarda TaxID=252184 RepID=A0AA39WCD9_9PEZI|nr:hypothetical protein B0T17DRAFT_407580 [Bombardia bombarda]